MSIWLNPEQVVFDGQTLTSVKSVRMERRAERPVMETEGIGSHLVFADAPSVRTEITIERELTTALESEPLPGAMGTLEFETARGRTNAERRTLNTKAVVLSTTVSLSRAHQSMQTIRFIAISNSGAVDPIGMVGGGL